jgi:hypothetical protein
MLGGRLPGIEVDIPLVGRYALRQARYGYPARRSGHTECRRHPPSPGPRNDLYLKTVPLGKIKA